MVNTSYICSRSLFVYFQRLLKGSKTSFAIEWWANPLNFKSKFVISEFDKPLNKNHAYSAQATCMYILMGDPCTKFEEFSSQRFHKFWGKRISDRDMCIALRRVSSNGSNLKNKRDIVVEIRCIANFLCRAMKYCIWWLLIELCTILKVSTLDSFYLHRFL